MKKVTSITLHDDPSTAAKSAGGETNVLLSVVGLVEAHKQLGTPGTLAMTIMAGSAFGQNVYDNDWFSELDTLKVTFDDASIEMWVIEERTTGFTGEDIQIKCLPYWVMLARRDLRVNREPLGIVDTTLTIYRKSPQACLDEIFTHNAPPHFAAGTVSSFFDGVTVSVEANNSDHLELIRQLCIQLAEHNAGYPAEFVENWSGSTCSIDIVPFEGASAAEIADTWTPDADSRIISGPTGAFSDEPNRLINRVTRGMSEAWNRIIPTAGPKETPVTIGQTFWDITTAVFSTPSTTITFTQKPFGGSLDLDADETIYFGSGDNWYPITSISASASHSIVVTGDASALTEGRFAVDSEGSELVYLGASTATGDDVFEASAHFDQVVPYVNLLEEAGVSTDFATWDSGLPVGTTKVGSPTVTQIDVVDPDTKAYVRHGESSAKVVANKGEGVKIGSGLLTLVTTDVEKTFSFVLNVGVPTGRVRCVLVDAGGKRHPQGIEQAESKVANLTGVNKGGLDADAGAAYLEVIAQEDGTVFYLDSVNITRSVGWWEYVDQMGPRALWKAGREALTQQMISRDFYDTEFIDPKYIDDDSEEVTIGSHVRIRDGYKNGTYRTSVTGRVQEIKYVYSNNLESIKKTVKVSRPRPDFANRFKTGSITGIPGLSAGIEQPSDFFLSEFAGTQAGDAVATISEDTAAGDVDTLVMDILENVRYGTLLEIKGDPNVSFWNLENLTKGQVSRQVKVSLNEPAYTTGNEGKAGSVTNQEDITIAALETGDNVFTPSRSVQSRLYQDQQLIEAVITRLDLKDSVTNKGIVGEEISGEVTSIALSSPPRTKLRKDWQMYIETSTDNQHFTLSDDVDAGALSLPVYAVTLDVKVGDLVMTDPDMETTFLRLEPQEIEAAVTERRKSEGIVALTTPITVAGAPYTSLNVLSGTVGTALDDNDVLIIQDRTGASHAVTINGDHAGTETAITIDSFTPNYEIIDGVLMQPQSSSYAGIRVANNTIALIVSGVDPESVNLASITLRVDDNETAVAAQAAITTANGLTAMTNLTLSVSTNTTDIGTNSSAISTLNSTLSTNGITGITNITGRVDSNEDDIGTNSSAITTLNATLSTNGISGATNITGRVSTAETDIGTNSSAITTLNSTLSTNGISGATNITGRVTTAETDIGTNASAVTSINATLTNNGLTSMTDITSTVDTIGARVVVTVDVNGTIGTISLESGATGTVAAIDANQINLTGDVTIDGSFVVSGANVSITSATTFASDVTINGTLNGVDGTFAGDISTDHGSITFALGGFALLAETGVPLTLQTDDTLTITGTTLTMGTPGVASVTGSQITLTTNDVVSDLGITLSTADADIELSPGGFGNATVEGSVIWHAGNLDPDDYVEVADIGTTVQAFDTHLNQIAGLTPGTSNLMFYTSGGSWAVLTLGTGFSIVGGELRYTAP